MTVHVVCAVRPDTAGGDRREFTRFWFALRSIRSTFLTTLLLQMVFLVNWIVASGKSNITSLSMKICGIPTHAKCMTGLIVKQI